MSRVGIVVIGRNEGERLRLCLLSARPDRFAVVYVDSGSSDGSVALAESLGVTTVALDMSVPFTAARARNVGFRRLREIVPGLEYVQFVDGDCEMDPNWIEAGGMFLDREPSVAVVCGRLRERHPERSIYNALCDMEWDTPVGEAKSCGGIAMVRAAAFEAEQGFRNDLIAGEEPELCLRLRARGWKIWRLDHEMALHDAAMTRFGQWWKRATRAGYAFAQGAYLHGGGPEQHWVRETRSAWFWAGGIPIAALVGGLYFGYAGLLPLVAYPLQTVRIFLRALGRSRSPALQAFFLMLGKFPELLGQFKFIYVLIVGSQGKLIEYK